jgi:hypothetical protein
MTFMNEENTQEPDEQDPDETEVGSPIPDPEDEDSADPEDVPGAV